MSRFGVSDGAAFHQKVVDAGNEAFGAWTRAGSWSSAPENLTDGYIPPGIAATIAPPRVWKKLRAVGLTEAPSGDRAGEQIHGYLEHNPSAEQVRAKRKAWADRQRKHRDHDEESPHASRRDNAVTHASPVPIPDPDPAPEHTRSAPTYVRVEPAPPVPLDELRPGVRAVAIELGDFARIAAAEGNGVAISVCERLDQGQMPSPKQLASLRRARDERARPSARSPPRAPDVQRAEPGSCWSNAEYLTDPSRLPPPTRTGGYGGRSGS